MKNEYEAKFLLVDVDDITQMLMNTSAILKQPKRLMRRRIFPHGEKGGYAWVRVRDEGNRVTMTYKRIVDAKRIDGTKELELIVEDFERACVLLETLGMQSSMYRENYREEWQLDGVCISIDYWPGLAPLMEIEADTPQEVEKAARLLGLDINEAMYGSIGHVYEQALGIPIAEYNKIERLTLDNAQTVLSGR